MFVINLDVGQLVALSNDLQSAAQKAMNDAGRELAAQTYGHIVEEAGKKLHTRRQLFIDSLKYMQVNEDTWVVHLDAKAVWIDEGLPAHNMLENLLRSPKAKTAKDGSKYVTVPFDHSPGKGKTAATPAQQDLINTIKAELKARKIPFGKIEKDQSGNALTGKLHSFDITKNPIKHFEGPGQGKGPVGAVKQGPTGIPFLQGVQVYQKKGRDGKIKRTIMTFRTASSKHAGQGRWDHPGLEAVNLMEDGARWAKEQWEREIGPKVLDAFLRSI
jgi:hypothetical protein